MAKLILDASESKKERKYWAMARDALTKSSGITELVTEPPVGATLVTLAESFSEAGLYGEALAHAALGITNGLSDSQLLESAISIILARCDETEFEDLGLELALGPSDHEP